MAHLDAVNSDTSMENSTMTEKLEMDSTQRQESDVEIVQAKDMQRAMELQSVNPPLVTHMYSADPSAHVFEGKIYVYSSHDIETDAEFNDDGEHFAMRDYHVLSVPTIGEPAVDHGVALTVEDIPWVKQQLWAPDAAYRDGKYYLFFPAKDHQDVFRIGVAVSDSPAGPFVPNEAAIENTFSIDPAVFADKGEHYLYFGGIWGGQLQAWTNGSYTGVDNYPAEDEPALTPKMAKLNADMGSLAEPVKDILVLDEFGKPLRAGDTARRYFEGPWVHKYNDKYYFSYSTGDTHKIVYATGDSPYGPFHYQGVVLEPVLGWTTHHSIVEYQNKWYLFYHDSTLSKGQTHLRCVKMIELHHDDDGRIATIDAYS
jgi:hypothetical protein